MFTKLCAMLKTIPPESIPPLVLQLLEFSKTSSQFSRTLLDTVNARFSSKLSPEEREGGERNLNLDSLELTTNLSQEQLIQAEGTVIYHLSQASKVNNTICKEIMEMVSAGANAPEILLTPFSLFLALSMISIKHCQARILSGVKAAIMKAIFIEDSRQNNHWLRQEAVMKTRAPDIGDLFSLVITQCRQAGGWDLIFEGLQSLGMELLDATHRTKAEAGRVKTVQNIGARLLIKLIKKMPDSVHSVLPFLINKILLSSHSLQYTEALRVIVSDCSTILMERSQCLTHLMDNLSRLSYNIARRSLLALLPLFKMSRSIRDSLILVLRKLLFSPKVSSMEAATAGVMLMLRTVKIPGSRCLSQTMSQSSGSLSQIALDVGMGRSSLNAESVCLELLGALRKSFGQPCQVRVILYRGIIDTVNYNSQLCEGAVDLLYSHLLTLWGAEGSSRNRWEVGLDLIFKVSGDDWVLEEPLGWLVSCLQQLVVKAGQVLGEEHENLSKIVTLLDEMVEKYGKNDAGELGFDDFDCFDRKTSRGAKKHCQVEQLQGLLESLMEYVFSRGAEREEDRARQLIRLFNVHCSLSKVVEASEKKARAKKGEKQKKGGKKDNANTSVTVADKTSEETPWKEDYQPPLNCVSLKCLSLMLKTVLTDRTEENQTAVLLLRSNSEFLSFVLITLDKKLKEIAENLKINGDEEKASNSEFRYLSSICQTLFYHSVVSQEPVQVALTLTTALLERTLALLLCYFPRRKEATLACLTREEVDQPLPPPQVQGSLNTTILPAVKHLQQKVEFYGGRLEDPDEEDVAVRMAVCVGLVRTLFEEMTEDEGLEEAAELLKTVRSDPPEDTSVLQPLVSLILLMKTKTNSKSTDNFLQEMCKRLHYLAGDLNQTVVIDYPRKKYSWLVDDNKYHILPIVLGCLDNHLSQAETVLSWIKSLSSCTVTPEKTICQAEQSLCYHLVHQVNSISELVKTALTLEATDGVIRVLSKLYTIMASLAKHFLIRLKSNKAVVRLAKFDFTIKHIDKNLSKFVHGLQKYIEESKDQDLKQKEVGGKKNAKRKAVDPNQAGLKIIKDSKGVTNLILKMEMMHMDVIKLGKRMGEKLIESNNFHNRDFKLRMENRKEDVESEEEVGEEEEEEGEGKDVSGAPTPVHQSTAMDDLTNLGGAAAPGTGEEGPAKKKRRLYSGSSANLLADSSQEF